MNIQSEKMRKHHSVKSGVSLSREFTDAEKMQRQAALKKEFDLRKKYSIDGVVRPVTRHTWFDDKVIHVTNFEPCKKIYPEPITPIAQKFDGVETVGSCFGMKEKIYLPKKNIAL